MRWKKPYDTAPGTSTYKKGVGDFFFFFIVSYSCHLIQRIRSFRALNETQKFFSLSALENIPCRVPAGSVLDPMLFNISLTTWMTE